MGNAIVDTILEVLYEVGKILPRPFETKYQHVKRLRGLSAPQFQRGVRHLEERGLVKVIRKNDQKFIQITKQGQLKILLQKAKIKNKQKWDGKWRLVVFDIPEDSKNQRRLFRLLLKQQGFYKLQASVYISPYPLNREAIAYLNQTGLIGFIRILRVDEMDNDKILRRYFRL